MKKYLKAECVFSILAENNVLDCDGEWKRERQQVMYHVPCFFLSKDALTCMRSLAIFIRNNEYLLTFNSIESLLSCIPKDQKQFVSKALNDCLIA